MRTDCGRSCFALYYDEGYQEEAADIEICLPVSKQINNENISSRMLKGGKAVSLNYQGSYEHIGQG